MVLYPFGGFTEFTIYISAANMFSELGMYQMKLPNMLNFSITLLTVLRVQAVVLLGAVTSLMWYFWKMRQRKYGK